MASRPAPTPPPPAQEVEEPDLVDDQEDELEEEAPDYPTCISDRCNRPVVIRGDAYCALCEARRKRRKK